MYTSVPREQIADTLIHLRGLFREVPRSNEKEDRARERRELLAKNLLSNLSRTKDHPTLHTVLEVAEAFSLTLGGAHRLFGYELQRILEFDLKLNSARTHIIETYPFERDLPVELPFRMGNDDVFARTSTLQDLVPEWQSNVPIRALENAGWKHPGAFYVHVGTEDSLESSLPPGAVALVVPIDKTEQIRPDVRATYLLQFGNGYRCSRCVVSRGKLILLSSGRRYSGPREFSYPSEVRIAGRIRMFALRLPLPEYPLLSSLPRSDGGAPLILPWEQSSIDRLFTTKHRRFPRPRKDIPWVQEILESIFNTTVSARTARRYRRPTSSVPHVDALIQLSVSHLTRYTDALRVQRTWPSDRGRYSLETLLNTRHFADLPKPSRRPHLPIPKDRWDALLRDFVEWPMLLSLRFPELRSLDQRIVRLAKGSVLQGIDPPLFPGTLILLDEITGKLHDGSNAPKTGWNRRIYALRRETEVHCGYLDRSNDSYVLHSGVLAASETILVRKDELHQLHSISGVAVPL